MGSCYTNHEDLTSLGHHGGRGGELIFRRKAETPNTQAKPKKKCGQNRGFPRVFACFAEQTGKSKQAKTSPVRRLSTLNGDLGVLEPQNSD